MRSPASQFLRSWFLYSSSLACALLTAALIGGCGSADDAAKNAASKDDSLPTIEASVFRVDKQVWPMVVRSQGSLMADETAVVGAKVAGRVNEVHIDLGDVVKAGEPLITLDRTQFDLLVDQTQAQLAQARAAVGLKPDSPLEDLKPESAPPVRQEKAIWDEARSNLERARRLRLTNSITQSELDQLASAEQVAEARYAAALNGVHEKIALISVRQAELSLAREQLHDAVIRAPFDGLVQQKQVAPGTYVQVGDSIATVVRTNPLRFRGTMPERHAQNLSIGQTVRLRVESVSEPLSVHVTRISPSLDHLSRSLLFEAKIDNSESRFRTGLFAEAEVVVDSQATALVVPQSAVVEFAGAEKVWKVVDGLVGEQEVLTGLRRGDRIEILQGLEPGDVILLDKRQGMVANIAPIHDVALGFVPAPARLGIADKSDANKVNNANDADNDDADDDGAADQQSTDSPQGVAE